MEELQQPMIGPELDQRRDLGMIERRIGIVDDAAERRLADGVADEGLDDPLGEIGIGKTCEAGQVRRAQGRPALGHIEPAVARQTGKQNARAASPVAPYIEDAARHRHAASMSAPCCRHIAPRQFVGWGARGLVILCGLKTTLR